MIIEDRPLNEEPLLPLKKIVKEQKKAYREAKKATKPNKGGIKGKLVTLGITSIVTIALMGFIVDSSLAWYTNWESKYYVAKHRVVETGSDKRSVSIRLSLPATVETKEKTVQVSVLPVDAKAQEGVYKEPTDKEKEEIISKSDNPRIIRNIWNLETKKGKALDGHHIDCRKANMTNEFGYAALDKLCFSSFEESVATVDKWINERIDTNSLNQLLCLYNQGIATDTCTYAVNFQSMK